MHVAPAGLTLAMSAEALHQRLPELILGLCGTLQPTFSVAIVPLEEISCRKQTVKRRSGPLSRGGGRSCSPRAFSKPLTDAA